MALDLLRRGLKIPHLRLLAELSGQSKLTDAAANLGMTQPAASRLISEIEKIVEAEVYVRSGRGIELTDVGRKLALRCVRIVREMADAGREIDQYKKGQSGHVSIGSVTGPAIEHVLPALNRIRYRYPEITVFIEVGPSSSLVQKLADARLDFVLCRVPVDSAPENFEERPLVREPVCLIGRAGHPLSRGGAPLPAQALTAFDWILPPIGQPLRTSVELAFKDKGMALPGHYLTVSSFLYTLIAVMKSDAIAPIAESVARSFAFNPDGGEGGLCILDTDLDLSLETFSFLTRKGQILTPAADIVAQEIVRAVSGGDPIEAGPA